MPSLSDCISQTTDEYGRSTYTLNTSTDALRANTEAWRENAMQQAYQEQLTEMYKQQAAVLIEQQKNSIGLTDAEYKQEEANKRLNDTLARMDELWSEAAKEAEEYNKEYPHEQLRRRSRRVQHDPQPPAGAGAERHEAYLHRGRRCHERRQSYHVRLRYGQGQSLQPRQLQRYSMLLG